MIQVEVRVISKFYFYFSFTNLSACMYIHRSISLSSVSCVNDNNNNGNFIHFYNNNITTVINLTFTGSLPVAT